MKPSVGASFFFSSLFSLPLATAVTKKPGGPVKLLIDFGESAAFRDRFVCFEKPARIEPDDHLSFGTQGLETPSRHRVAFEVLSRSTR